MSLPRDLSWGRRVARRAGVRSVDLQQSPEREPELRVGDDREGSEPQVQSRQGAQSVVHEEQSVHNADQRAHAGEPVGPALQQLVDALFRAVDGRAREPERVGSYTISDFLKLVTAMKNLGTAKFRGEPDPVKADEWLEELETNFDATLCPEEYKKTIAVYYLEQEAKAWWRSTERQLGDAEVTWDFFKSEFLAKYFPSEARDRLERRFLNLYQGSWSVRQYETEFTKLRRYVYRGQSDEATMVRYFLNGLKPEISSRLVAVDFSSLNRLVERAVLIEDRLGMARTTGSKTGVAGASQSGKPRSDFSRPQASGRGSTFSAPQARTGGRPGNCFSCGQPGHISRNCPVSRSGAAGRPESRKRERPAPESVTCFACGEKGHYANACPSRGAVSGPSVNRPRSEMSKAEPSAKKKTGEGRVFALTADEPGSSSKGPVAGM